MDWSYKMMAQQVVALVCNACKSLSEPVNMESSLFDIAGFEDVVMEWSDFKDEVPTPDTIHWVRSDRPPMKGEVRTVNVHHPFYMAVGEPFWILYTPVLSSLNGWDSHPEEIEQSSFVRCFIERVLDQNESKAWLQVKILDVLMIRDYNMNFPVRDGSNGYLDDFEMFGQPHIFCYKDWLYISAGAEGDLGVWALVKQVNSQYYMLVYGDWGFHKYNAFGGNILLPNQQIEAWINQAIHNHRYNKVE